MDFFEDSSASPAPAGDFASAPLEDFGDFGGASPAPAEAGGDFFGSPAGSFEAAAPATGSLDGSFEGSSFDAPAAGDSFGGSFEAAPVDAAQGSFDAGSFGSGSGSFGADSGSFDAAPAAASSFEGSFDAGVGEAPAPVVASDSFGGSFEGSSFEATPAAAEPIMDSSFEAPAEVAPIDAFAATPVAVEEAAAPASPMSSFGAVQVTSDLMRQYELEHNKFLEEKIAEEKAKHAEVVAQAKKDLDNFYAERKQRSSKARAENIAASDSTTGEAPASDKEAWTNLASLVDLNDSSLDTATTERMRSVVLDMKHAA